MREALEEMKAKAVEALETEDDEINVAKRALGFIIGTINALLAERGWL